ncbi:MAG: transglutaminase-like domain-containing protein [Bacteroidota bacterium]
MPDPKQLPYLLKLLDDDSLLVREIVLKELASFGPALEEELARQGASPHIYRIPVIQTILEDQNRIWVKKRWSSWFRLKEDRQRLEAALNLIAQFQNGKSYPVKLKSLLDELAREYDSTYKNRDARVLSNFLFKVKRLEGARSDYYNPLNSNLVHVIEEKRGIPITLACIYILVGHRLGLNIRGVNFPGHFLARASIGKRKIIVDCFNGGRFLDEGELAKLKNAVPIVIDHITRLECDARTIIGRVLRNLINAYHRANNEANVRCMGDLLRTLGMEDVTLE